MQENNVQLDVVVVVGCKSACKGNSKNKTDGYILAYSYNYQQSK